VPKGAPLGPSRRWARQGQFGTDGPPWVRWGRTGPILSAATRRLLGRAISKVPVKPLAPPGLSAAVSVWESALRQRPRADASCNHVRIVALPGGAPSGAEQLGLGSSRGIRDGICGNAPGQWLKPMSFRRGYCRGYPEVGITPCCGLAQQRLPRRDRPHIARMHWRR
jgi:hypothetical protein